MAENTETKRTQADVEQLIRNSTQKQWLTAQQVMGIDRAELQADEGASSVFLAVLIGGTYEHWLNAPLHELEAHLNLADDEPDAA